MRLLVDTDAFCKLAAVALFGPAIHLLGGEAGQVERLAALPHMLRRGRLRKQLGGGLADSLVAEAEALPLAPRNEPDALTERLNASALDPGEVQLLWVVAQGESLLVTSDKRAVRDAAAIDQLRPRIDRKIVVLESVLIALCNEAGPETIRNYIIKNSHVDTVYQTCFSSSLEDPRVGLRSHLSALEREVHPLRLWAPEAVG